MNPPVDFNPRAHEGHDRSVAYSVAPGTFQSTCPRGARLDVSLENGRIQLISIHVPTRGTTRCIPREWPDSTYFNPRAHEGHDPLMMQGLIPLPYFNPRAHEGHDFFELFCNFVCEISIHVPTRGTTFVLGAAARILEISIHVPTRGTTNFARYLISLMPISIHVPTRGTTLRLFFCIPKLQISIHVPTRGTTMLLVRKPALHIFQSTCPRGARLPSLVHRSKACNFNPRAHEGHDQQLLYMQFLPQISIHVPTRGTTVRRGLPVLL